MKWFYLFSIITVVVRHIVVCEADLEVLMLSVCSSVVMLKIVIE